MEDTQKLQEVLAELAKRDPDAAEAVQKALDTTAKVAERDEESSGLIRKAWDAVTGIVKGKKVKAEDEEDPDEEDSEADEDEEEDDEPLDLEDDEEEEKPKTRKSFADYAAETEVYGEVMSGEQIIRDLTEALSKSMDAQFASIEEQRAKDAKQLKKALAEIGEIKKALDDTGDIKKALDQLGSLPAGAVRPYAVKPPAGGENGGIPTAVEVFEKSIAAVEAGTMSAVEAGLLEKAVKTGDWQPRHKAAWERISK